MPKKAICSIKRILKQESTQPIHHCLHSIATMELCREARLLLLLTGIWISTSLSAKLDSVYMTTTIRSRFAETLITGRIRNKESYTKEVEFLVILPYEAFIHSFSIRVGGRYYHGFVEEKRAAEQKYKIAKRMDRFTSLLEARADAERAFRTNVTVPAKKTVEIRLVYHQLLRRINGKYKSQMILIGSDLADDLFVEFDLCESREIKNVRALDIITGDGRLIKPEVTVIQDHKNIASVWFHPIDSWVNSVLLSYGGSFTIEYELASVGPGGELILDNRNFIHFFAPSIDIRPRRIIFLLDVSSSMKSKKMKYMKTAIENIIGSLSEKDRLGIVAFWNDFSVWKVNDAEINPATESNVISAKSFIRDLSRKKRTDLFSAITKAMSILEKDTRGSSPDPKSNYIVLFTDGMPRSRQTSIQEQTEKLKEISNINKGRFAIHAIGIGLDVDMQVLRKITNDNSGRLKQVMMNVNMAVQIQSYLDDLGVNLLEPISFSYPGNIKDKSTLLQNYRGGEYVTTGQLDPTKASGSPQAVVIKNNQGKITRLSVDYITQTTSLPCNVVSKDKLDTFVKKANGLVTIMGLMKMLENAEEEFEKLSLENEIKTIAIRYSLVTPLTSMVIVRPQDRREVEEQFEREFSTTTPAPTTTRPTVAPTQCCKFKEPTLWGGFGDPHMIVQLTKSNKICFEFDGKEGEAYSILHDPANGVFINARVSSANRTTTSGRRHPTYFNEVLVALTREDIFILIPLYDVVVMTSQGHLMTIDMELNEDQSIRIWNIAIFVRKGSGNTKILEIHVDTRIAFAFKIHADHIDIEIPGTEYVSSETDGVLGQFPRIPVYDDKYPITKNPDDGEYYLMYRNHNIPVRRKMAKVMNEEYVFCWHVGKTSLDLFLAKDTEFYKIDSLFDEPPFNT